MEIRTLESKEREALLDLLDAWELPDGWRGRDFFKRRMTWDPSFQDENVWVAAERSELVACVQIVPRWLKILGHGIPTGGIGGVFCRTDCRGGGITTALLERAATAMRERGMELSLLFGQKRDLYGRLGWKTWKGQRSILRKGEIRPPSRAPAAGEHEVELVAFDRARDRALAAVKAIHSAYSSSRSGTVVRDDALWEASLKLAGNPDEEFWVARRGGLAVAYARAALLDGVLTVTELGRFEDGAVALARLIASLLQPREDDALAPPGKSSQELRSFLVLPTFDDIGLTVSLEHESVASHPLDDETGMLRCLNVTALSARLDVDLLPGEDGAAFLQRILPPDGFVFWPADRF